MNYIKSGIRRTLKVVNEHKLIFLFILLFQIGILVLSSFIFIHYQLKIISDSQSIINLMEEANYDPIKIEKGEPFIKDAAIIYQSYESLKMNLLYLGMWLLFVFMFINGLVWVMTQRILKKASLLEMGHQWIKYIASSFSLITPLLLITYYILRQEMINNLDTGLFTQTINIFLYVTLGIYFFLLNAFAFISVRQWKSFIKSFIRSSVIHIHKSLLLLSICWAAIGGTIYLVYLSFSYQWPLALMIVLMTILVFIIAAMRIFWTAGLYELANK